MAQLLSTKLQPPPLRDERVYRPSLYEHLSGVERGVVLVSAPPGFGKSTLVVEWLESQGRSFSWYSLDSYDSDVGLFGEYLARAVGALTGRESGLVSVPGEQTPDARTMIATLIEDLKEAPTGGALVLDDYHKLEGREVHEIVNYLVDNLPEGLVLVVITRADPPLPLSRMRAAGLLREIRGADLRFTSDQIAEFFSANSEASLHADQLEIVTERSEGWIAALHLASLGADVGTPVNLTDSLSAQHPHIASYLVDEVLDHLRPELATFLLDTSPLERFDSDLCRDVAGVPNATDLIDEIERQNAFLIPLGREREWFRYHHLFADLLRSKLRRSDPDRHDALLNAAAKSCEQRGLHDDAIDYALSAGNMELAGAIVDRSMGSVLGAGEVTRLRSWLRRFPSPADPVQHVLTLGWAWCRIFEGNLDAATELLDRIEADQLSDFPSDPRGQLGVMRAMVAFQAGDKDAAERHAREGLEKLPHTSLYLESLGHLYVGRALHANGERLEARPHLERAAGLAERGNKLAAATALFWLAVADMDLGNLVDAERSMVRAQDVASAGNSSNSHPASGVGDIGLAYIRLNQLDAREAARLAERGTQLLKRSNFVEMVFRGFFVWAEALSVAGRHEEARDLANEGIEWLQGRSIGGGPLETWLLMAQARNSWRSGQFEDARARLDQVQSKGLGSPNKDEALGFYEAADAVSFAIRRGDLDEARQLMEAVPVDPTQNVMFTIKRLVLTAALHEMDGDARKAVETVEEALDLAQPGYRFQFSFVAPVMRPVLNRMVGRTKHDEFVRSILERMPEETGTTISQPVDPLTARELDVLSEIAAGYTNEEIADRLFISRGTVKRHASNIYMKLGAHHRAEAAAKGRELGLID